MHTSLKDDPSLSPHGLQSTSAAGGGRPYLFIHSILWSDMDRNPEMGGVCSHLHFLPSSYPEALCLRLCCGKYWTVPATCVWFHSESSPWGMVRLRGRKACLAWCQIELHGGSRAQVSHALLCFPREPALPGPWVRGLGCPQGGGRRQGIRAQTDSVLASWMWGLTSQKSLFSDVSTEVFQSLI